MPAITMDNTYDATHHVNHSQPGDDPAITVCLIVIPVIWIILVMGMLGCTTAAIGLALVLAMLAGGAGGAMRHIWLVRRAAQDRHPISPRPNHLV